MFVLNWVLFKYNPTKLQTFSNVTYVGGPRLLQQPKRCQLGLDVPAQFDPAIFIMWIHHLSWHVVVQRATSFGRYSSSLSLQPSLLFTRGHSGSKSQQDNPLHKRGRATRVFPLSSSRMPSSSRHLSNASSFTLSLVGFR